MSYQLSLARKRLKTTEDALAQALLQGQQAPKLHQRRAQKARGVIRKLAKIAGHPVMKPDNKARKIQEVAHEFLSRVGREDPEEAAELAADTDWQPEEPLECGEA